MIIDHDTCTIVSSAAFPPVTPRFSRSCAHPACMPDPAGKKLCCVYPHVCARYGAIEGSRHREYKKELAPAPAATADAPRRAPIDPGPPSHLSDASVAADASDAVSSYFTVPGAAEVSGLVTAPLGGFTGSGSLDGGDESGGERFHRRPADPCAPAIGDEPAIVSRDSTCPAPFIGGIDASAARSASAFAASTSRSAASSSSTRVSNHGGGGGRGGVFGGGLGGLGGGAGAGGGAGGLGGGGGAGGGAGGGGWSSDHCSVHHGGGGGVDRLTGDPVTYDGAVIASGGARGGGAVELAGGGDGGGEGMRNHGS